MTVEKIGGSWVHSSVQGWKNCMYGMGAFVSLGCKKPRGILSLGGIRFPSEDVIVPKFSPCVSTEAVPAF